MASNPFSLASFWQRCSWCFMLTPSNSKELLLFQLLSPVFNTCLNHVQSNRARNACKAVTAALGGFIKETRWVQTVVPWHGTPPRREEGEVCVASGVTLGPASCNTSVGRRKPKTSRSGQQLFVAIWLQPFCSCWPFAVGFFVVVVVLIFFFTWKN